VARVYFAMRVRKEGTESWVTFWRRDVRVDESIATLPAEEICELVRNLRRICECRSKLD
jgi:hypothetical protein